MTKTTTTVRPDGMATRLIWTPLWLFIVTGCGTQPLDGGVLNVHGSGGSAGVGTGGSGDIGGTAGSAGQAGGPTLSGTLPCDVYASDGGACVAAHSTVRALFAAYGGFLYQVKKADGTTRDIGVVSAGGLADAADQDAFCGSAACTISIIYDQSGGGNYLTVAPGGQARTQPDQEANAKVLPITIGGHNVYGVHSAPGIGYRNNVAKGTATGDKPETIYMITSGDIFNAGCCFAYGNAETDNRDNGEGAMEAVYFGSNPIWGRGAGNGPWVMGLLENGIWAGDTTLYEANTPMTSHYVTAVLKGDVPGSNHWVIKAGNGQSGTLTTMFDGPRPSPRYNPMHKEGAIVLGISGDNSAAGQGNFFEGVMTAHFSSDAADAAVQANIVSVYGL